MSILYTVKQKLLQSKKSYVTHKDIGNIYNKLSKTYSSSKSSHFLENYKSMFSYIDLKENSRVLEIGCGDGFFSKVIPENCQYLGIDISGEMITEATKNNRRNRKNVFFEKVDAKEFIKYSSSNSYDLIVFSFSWKYFESDFTKNLINLLKKDGTLIIVDDFKGNFKELFDLYEDFKLINKKDLVKINTLNYLYHNTDALNSELSKTGFAQAVFLTSEKDFSSEKDYLINSGAIPELISEFGNASELYINKFVKFIEDNNYVLPKQEFFICIAKK